MGPLLWPHRPVPSWVPMQSSDVPADLGAIPAAPDVILEIPVQSIKATPVGSNIGAVPTAPEFPMQADLQNIVAPPLVLNREEERQQGDTLEPRTNWPAGVPKNASTARPLWA
eukprot:2360045-Amphidinium_carterae.1